MKQPPSPNDPILTDYVLDELPRDQAAELTALLRKPGNQELVNEVTEIDTLSTLLSQGLAHGETLKLSPAQRSAIFQSAKAPTAEDIKSTYKKQWLRPVLVTLGAAAAVAIVVITMSNIKGDKPTLAKHTTSSPESTAPVIPSTSDWQASNAASGVASHRQSPSNPPHTPDSAPTQQTQQNHPTHKPKNPITAPIAITENPWQSRAKNAMSRLPLHCGNASWDWLQTWLKSPPATTLDPNAVRIDEIINHFTYHNPADLTIGDLQLGMELVQCPWNPKHKIAAVLVQNRSTTAAQVEAAVNMANAVTRYRLLGYAHANDSTLNRTSADTTNMPAGATHLILYELELDPTIAIGADVLSVSLRSTGSEQQQSENSFSIQLSDNPWENAAQDIQFSLILATWSQFLTHSQLAPSITADQLKQMINHFTTHHALTKPQTNAINTIRTTLNRLNH